MHRRIRPCIQYSILPFARQIPGPLELLPAFILGSFSLDITSSMISGSASATVSGLSLNVSATVWHVDMSSTGEDELVSSLTLEGSSGAFKRLLASASNLVASNIAGITIPDTTAALTAAEAAVSSGIGMAAQIVMDAKHGLRLLNISLTPPSGRLSFSELASRIGISWPQPPQDVMSLTGGFLYFAPKYKEGMRLPFPGSTTLAPALGIGATFDVPSLNVFKYPGFLDILPQADIYLQVCTLGHAASAP